MEEQLNFFPPLSLKEMIFRRIAILFWSHPDVLTSVSNFKVEDWYDKRETWESIEDVVKLKLSKLSLPELLLKKVSDAATFVGLEIREWKKIHEHHYRNDIGEGGLPGSTKLCWTTTGRINYGETVKELFRNKFDVVTHYSVACNYCFEDYIKLFWGKLSKYAKDNFSYEGSISSGLSFQWPHMLKGEYSKLDEWAREKSGLSFHQYSFELAAKTGRESAAGYFLRKLSPEEREACVLRCAYDFGPLGFGGFIAELMTKGVHYSLTLMTPGQQMDLLKRHPAFVLISFFDTPWPDPFYQNAPLIWKHLAPSHYPLLHDKMLKRYQVRVFKSPPFFRKFFGHAPPEFKKWFVDPDYESLDAPACGFLSAMIQRGDSECTRALFRELDAADRVKLVFHPDALRHFASALANDRRRMVEVCLRAAELSEKERKALRKELARVRVDMLQVPAFLMDG